MNEHLRDRILRKLEALSEERAYQVLDYIEFLSSKYAERPAPVQQNIFTKFTEAIEDRLRAGKVSSSAIAETMNLMNRAVKVLDGVAAAGRSVATDVAQAGRSMASDIASATGSWNTPGQPAGQPDQGAGASPPPVPPSPPGSGPPKTADTTESAELNPPGPTAAGGAEGTDHGTNPGGRS